MKGEFSNTSEVFLTVVLIFFLGETSFTQAQYHYVPAQILIPALNSSTFNAFRNNSNNPYNNFYPPINNNFTNYYNQNRTGWNNPALNRTVGPFNRTSNRTNQDGHLILGTIGYMDRLLFNQVYFKPSRWYSGREKIIEYPKDVPGGYVRHETVSAVRVYNQFYDGADSTAEVTGGGIGRKFIKIKLSSNWGKGFKYLVQIFGH